MSANDPHHNHNEDEEEDSLPRITTDVEIATSDMKHVNDEGEPHNKFNCYLTTAGGLMGKPVSELNAEVSDLIHDRASSIDIDRIKEIYDRLGFKYLNNFDHVEDFKRFIKKNIKKCERKKYAFASFYKRRPDDDSIELYGHVIGLKVQVKENNHYSYRFIDYQLEPVEANRANRYFKNKIPPYAETPFYLWEKIHSYDDDLSDMDWE